MTNTISTLDLHSMPVKSAQKHSHSGWILTKAL